MIIPHFMKVKVENFKEESESGKWKLKSTERVGKQDNKMKPTSVWMFFPFARARIRDQTKSFYSKSAAESPIPVDENVKNDHLDEEEEKQTYSWPCPSDVWWMSAHKEIYRGFHLVSNQGEMSSFTFRHRHQIIR